MALTRLIVAVAIVAIATAASFALATDYVVGDYNGWRLNYDYETWLTGKTFFVGDRLIFQYKQGTHDVLQVDALSFNNCAHPENVTPLRSGYDVVTLYNPGKQWFVCGFEGHCELGMKFSVTVWPTNVGDGGAVGGAGGGAAGTSGPVGGAASGASGAAAGTAGANSQNVVSAGIREALTSKFWILVACVVYTVIIV